MDVRFAPLPQFRSPLFRRKLFISTNPYHLARDYSAGMRDLQALCAKATAEAVWLFAPAREWYCISTKQIDGYHDGRLSGCQHPIFDFSQLGREIIHVQVHSDNLFSNQNEALSRILRAYPGLPLTKAFLLWEIEKLSHLPFPSADDYDAFKTMLNHHHSIALELRFQIVTKFGITTVKLIDLSVDHFPLVKAAAAKAGEKLIPGYFREPMTPAGFIFQLCEEINRQLPGIIQFHFSIPRKESRAV
jgi:hypothetical protein